MTSEELEAIASRKTTCHPFGETVTLSRAERDQLVGMAKRYAWLTSLKCNSFTLSRDDDHACNYMTAAEWTQPILRISRTIANKKSRK